MLEFSILQLIVRILLAVRPWANVTNGELLVPVVPLNVFHKIPPLPVEISPATSRLEAGEVVPMPTAPHPRSINSKWQCFYGIASINDFDGLCLWEKFLKLF